MYTVVYSGDVRCYAEGCVCTVGGAAGYGHAAAYGSGDVYYADGYVSGSVCVLNSVVGAYGVAVFCG